MKTVKAAKPVTSRDIAKLVVYCALLAALVLGASVSVALIGEGTPFTTALYTGLTTTALILVAMGFIGVLIVNDFRRRFEKGLRQNK